MWQISFLATIWFLWKETNSKCLEGKLASMDSLVDKIKFLVTIWLLIVTSFQYFSISSIMRSWYKIAFTQPLRLLVFPFGGLWLKVLIGVLWGIRATQVWEALSQWRGRSFALFIWCGWNRIN